MDGLYSGMGSLSVSLLLFVHNYFHIVNQVEALLRRMPFDSFEYSPLVNWLSGCVQCSNVPDESSIRTFSLTF